MFKNLHIYRIGADWAQTTEQVEEALARATFLPCAPTQPQSSGWVPACGIQNAPLVECINGNLLLKLLVEQRVLPAAVVKRRTAELAALVEQQTGRKPGKKVRKELTEQATHELLPQAFTKQSAIRVWIAPEQRLLMIDSASAARAEECVTLLVCTLKDLALHLIQTATSPAGCMSAWLTDSEAPAGFTVDRECELKSADEMKSVVRYGRHPLDIEEVRQHIAAGKAPTKLAMTFKDRVSFLLTDTLQVRKIAFLDVVFEGRGTPSSDEAFDADAAIATGELGAMLPELIEAMGGEHDFLGGRAAA